MAGDVGVWTKKSIAFFNLRDGHFSPIKDYLGFL